MAAAHSGVTHGNAKQGLLLCFRVIAGFGQLCFNHRVQRTFKQARYQCVGRVIAGGGFALVAGRGPQGKQPVLVVGYKLNELLVY